MSDHPVLNWPATPGYTPALEMLGRGLILGAVALFVLSILGYVLAAKKPSLERFSQIAFTGGCVALLLAFVQLIWLIYNRQYQFQYVYAHSDNWLPAGKRVASLWGGQEGSFLLWAVMAALFALVSVRATGSYRRWYTVTYAFFLGSLAAILSYESPFKLWQAPAEFASMLEGRMPPDGAGLTPALVNWWMQIHPPTIFVGFGSLTVLYAFAMAALLSGDLKSWTKLVRPWALISLTFTGLGLCMGGFWAYETLGWGGFWMWDPVENAALVPWLVVAAFIHGLFVQIARGKWPIANALFGGFGLISFIYGTFLTRSGFLGDASVHSFAEMDRNALWLLTTLGITCIVALVGMSIFRAVQLHREAPPVERPTVSPWNLTNAYGSGMSMLTALALASGIGMSVPLIMSIQGQQPKIVEEGVYNQITTWFFIPTILLMGLGPYLSWRGLPFGKIVQRLATAFALALGFLGVGMFLLQTIPRGMELEPTDTVSLVGRAFPTVPWVLILSFLCLLGITANLVRVAEMARKSPLSLGSFITHIGVIMTILGLILSRGLQKKVEFNVQAGRPGQALGYMVSIMPLEGSFFDRENQVPFRLSGRGEELVAKPILFYTENPNGDEPSPTVRPFIFHRPLHDLYVTVFPMVFEATEPTEIEVGGKRQFEGTIIEYLGLQQEGESGMMGTKFGARLRITTPDGVTNEVMPQIEITEQGPRQIRSEIDNYFIVLDRIDAASKSATIRLDYKNPIFPMELYYKPLTGLVWWGTGIMTVGGLLAAFYRRRMLKAAPSDDNDENRNEPPAQTPEDAPPAVAQV